MTRCSAQPPASPPLQRTPLHALHVEHGARMVAFADHRMPLNYAGGIIEEHLHTRRLAGLFDVSHMGQIVVRGDPAATASALEGLMPSDLLSLAAGRQKYALLTNPQGGIIDDLMVQNLGDRFILVVNAAGRRRDFEYLSRHLPSRACRPEYLEDRALLALQGPEAAAVLAGLGGHSGALGDFKFMQVRELTLAGADCIVSRSGYTGEDGFELSMPAADAPRLAGRLLADSRVRLIGLGARDSLRLEAGLCLYGHDLTAATTPVEATLNWAVSKARRAAGRRPGGFPGDSIILAQMPDHSARVRVGLLPAGRAPVRAEAPLLCGQSTVGEVTSGGFSPTLQRPIAMGYVAREHAGDGAELHALVRNKRLPVAVTRLPFVAPRFYR